MIELSTFLIWFCIGFIGMGIILNIIEKNVTPATFSLVLLVFMLIFLGVLLLKI